LLIKNGEFELSLERKHRTTENDHLSIHGADLADLCDTYGTPLFAFDEPRIRENYQRFYTAFERHYPKVAVCYSVKTTNNLAICKTLKDEGAYAEVGSGLDFHIAQKVGFSPERTVVDGLYKPEAVLRKAISDEVLIIDVESFAELELIDKIAKELGKKQSIGIRITTTAHKLLNPENLYCNPLSRFGFSIEDTDVVFRKALKLDNVEVAGVMIHPYWGIHWFLPLVKHIQTDLGVKIRFINFGGGFEKPGTRKIGITDLGKDYLRQKLGLESKLESAGTKKIREIEQAGKLIGEEVKATLGNADSTIVFEPGRYLVHDAGILLLRVSVVKNASGFKWVVVDGGVNLNSDWLERREIQLVNRMSAPKTEIVNVVGPLLFARDFVTIKQKLPEIQVGDILAVFNSGAYTLSNSTQFLCPRPSAVLIKENGQVSEIRERETYDDVTRMDRLYE